MGISQTFLSLFYSHPHGGIVVDREDYSKFADTDHLYFDMNFLLHTCNVCVCHQWLTRSVARRSENETQLMTQLLQYLDRFTAWCAPKKSVFLSLDGPGPVAKILTQRSRRIKLCGIVNRGVNVVQFTPGTPFMKRLKDVLCEWAVQKITYNPDFHVYVSGADRQGEGELKIFEHIFALPESNSKCIVHGADSDLILFGLKATNQHVKVIKGNCFQRFAGLMDTQALRSELTANLSGIDVDSIVDDFLLLTTLTGNDYLPRLNGFSLTTAWRQYQYLRATEYRDQPLYNEHTLFNWDFFKELLSEANIRTVKEAKKEHPRTILQRITQSYLPDGERVLKFKSNLVADGTVTQVYLQGNVIATGNGSNDREAVHSASVNTLHSEDFFGYLQKNLRTEYYQEVCELVEQWKAPLQSVPETPAVQKYLEGIAWSIQYISGKCVNYDYVYPYELSPSIKSILSCAGMEVSVNRDTSAATGLSPVEFCLSVMPAKAKQFVPLSFQRLMESGSEVGDLYLAEDGTCPRWESAQVSNVIRRVKNAVKSIPANSIHHNDKLHMSHQSTLLFTRPDLKIDLPTNHWHAFKPTNRSHVACFSEIKYQNSLRTYSTRTSGALNHSISQRSIGSVTSVRHVSHSTAISTKFHSNRLSKSIQSIPRKLTLK